MLAAEGSIQAQDITRFDEDVGGDVVVSLRNLKTYFPGPHLSAWPWSGRTTVKAFDLHSNALACLTGLGSPVQRAGAVTKLLQLLDAADATVTSIDEQPFSHANSCRCHRVQGRGRGPCAPGAGRCCARKP